MREGVCKINTTHGIALLTAVGQTLLPKWYWGERGSIDCCCQCSVGQIYRLI